MNATPLEFHYNPAPQRSPDWFKEHLGKVGASNLYRWLAVSKAKASLGKPLKARLDYEKELMFERQFGVNFNNFVSAAMQDGIDLEDFVRRQFEEITGHTCEEVGCWHNEFFVASPDRKLMNENIGLEIKVLRDASFVDVLMNGVPDMYWKQIQGQLWATGWEQMFFAALNLSTKKIAILEVEPDKEFHEYLAEAVQEKLVVEPFKLDEVHDVIGALPDWATGDTKFVTGEDWSWQT